MNAAPVTPDSVVHHERNEGSNASYQVNANVPMVSPVLEEDRTSPLFDNDYHHRYFDRGEENVSSDDEFVTLDSEEEDNYWLLHSLLSQGIHGTPTTAELTSPTTFAASHHSTSFWMEEEMRSEEERDDAQLEQQFSPLVPWRMLAGVHAQRNGDTHPRDGVPRRVQFVSVLDYDGDIEDNSDDDDNESTTDLDTFGESHFGRGEKAVPDVDTNQSVEVLRWLTRLANSSIEEDVLREWSTAACRLDGLPVPPDAVQLDGCPFRFEDEEDELEVSRLLNLMVGSTS